MYLLPTLTAVDTGVVILAGGLGTRFGGVKQLAEVDSDGAAIMDVLLRRAATAGFWYTVVRGASRPRSSKRSERISHEGIGPRAPPPMPVAITVQDLPNQPVAVRWVPPTPVLAAHEQVRGPFVVVNADDLYPTDTLHARGRTSPRGAGQRPPRWWDFGLHAHSHRIGPCPVRWWRSIRVNWSRLRREQSSRDRGVRFFETDVTVAPLRGVRASR